MVQGNNNIIFTWIPLFFITEVLDQKALLDRTQTVIGHGGMVLN